MRRPGNRWKGVSVDAPAGLFLLLLDRSHLGLVLQPQFGFVLRELHRQLLHGRIKGLDVVIRGFLGRQYSAVDVQVNLRGFDAIRRALVAEDDGRRNNAVVKMIKLAYRVDGVLPKLVPCAEPACRDLDLHTWSPLLQCLVRLVPEGAHGHRVDGAGPR